ncbi:MAG: phosphoribosylanthranilate isomerase, partial [Chloroflexota bacterium]
VAGAVPWETLRAYPAWAYLLDAYQPGSLGGTGQRWDWALAAQGRPAAARLIVAGGLTPDNVADALRAARPWGVDVSSGVEASPGRKHPVRVADFIAAVRAAERAAPRGEDGGA